MLKCTRILCVLEKFYVLIVNYNLKDFNQSTYLS